MRISDWSSDVCSSDLKVPVEKLSLCGGFGKISKLAAGHMDLHSRHSSIDLPQLAQWAAAIGASQALQDRKSVVSGKSVSVRVALGGCCIIKQNIISNN